MHHGASSRGLITEAIIQNSSVILIPLVERMFLLTDGTTTFRYRDLAAPGLARLLPHAASIFVMTGTEERTTEHRWNIFLLSGYTRTLEPAAPTALFAADIAANGSDRCTEFVTMTSFNLDSRVLIGCKNAQAGAAASAFASATLGVVIRK